MPGTRPNGVEGFLTHGERPMGPVNQVEISSAQKQCENRIAQLFDIKSKVHKFDFEKIGEATYEQSQGTYDPQATIELPHDTGYIVQIITMTKQELYFTKTLDGQQLLRPLKQGVTKEDVAEIVEAFE